jgi:hypothetical protein
MPLNPTLFQLFNKPITFFGDSWALLATFKQIGQGGSKNIIFIMASEGSKNNSNF